MSREMSGRRLLATGRAVHVIELRRYQDRAEWVEDLVLLAGQIPFIDPRCRAASALAPVATWAARTRSEAALRRLAQEIARQGPEWEALQGLGLRARAILAAEPGRAEGS